mmetsp:Transcript_3577/g.10160  ORF Transcript_3577/g.10160 Transcript_3577/m.10160 type:complete len:290 (-) Transcript_3577:416-1285(-)
MAHSNDARSVARTLPAAWGVTLVPAEQRPIADTTGLLPARAGNARGLSRESSDMSPPNTPRPARRADCLRDTAGVGGVSEGGPRGAAGLDGPQGQRAGHRCVQARRQRQHVVRHSAGQPPRGGLSARGPSLRLCPLPRPRQGHPADAQLSVGREEVPERGGVLRIQHQPDQARRGRRLAPARPGHRCVRRGVRADQRHQAAAWSRTQVPRPCPPQALSEGQQLQAGDEGRSRMRHEQHRGDGTGTDMERHGRGGIPAELGPDRDGHDNRGSGADFVLRGHAAGLDPDVR